MMAPHPESQERPGHTWLLVQLVAHEGEETASSEALREGGRNCSQESDLGSKDEVRGERV